MAEAATREELSFVPGPDTLRDFRSALGRFATGVTIVTTRTPEGPFAITANSFASLSLDPPLVLWSPAKASRRFEVFTRSDSFAIHVMAAEHSDLCGAVARDPRALDEVPLATGQDGVPVIEEAVARYDCQRHALHDAGDHAIVVGRVTRATLREGRPLLFLDGRMGGFAPH